MNKFQFNTGVNTREYPNNIVGGVDSGNGTIVIQFEADAPKGAKLAFLSDSDFPCLDKKLLKCEVKNSKLKSKFAYFHNDMIE